MRLNRHGQSIMPEYVVSFFLVIAVVVAITVYVKRSIQAKIYDERNYMVAVATSECDADCRKAAGLNAEQSIPEEYEPYYVNVISNVQRNSQIETRILADQGRSGVFRKYIKERNASKTTSEQAPPKEAR